MTPNARIAHLAGPNATIQNTPPLVTSNKARSKHGLPVLTNLDGSPARFDVLRPQRLAAPVTVYVEQFSAHPLEADAAELYGPPDGYIDSAGRVHKERQSASDRPVYEVELRPEDGLYPLPYMATQADGAAWEEECGRRNARSPEHPRAKARSARRARATSSQRRLRSTSIACCRRPAIRRVCPRGVDVVQRQRHAQIAPGGKGLDDRIDDPPFRAVEVAGQRSLDSGVVIGDRGLDHDSKASTSGRRRRSPDPRPRPPRLAHRG